MTARLERIVRYPVKGVRGHELATAEVTPGRGLAHDRCLALSNGLMRVQLTGTWTSSAAFYRLLKNPGMALFRATVSDDDPVAVQLTSPTGDTVRVRMSPDRERDADLAAANAVLRDWLPHAPLGPPRHRRFVALDEFAAALVSRSTRTRGGPTTTSEVIPS